MTAEGDNRVLMQKVAKELLSSTHLPAIKARLQVWISQPRCPQPDELHMYSWGWASYEFRCEEVA